MTAGAPVRPIHVLGPVAGVLFVLSFRHGLWLFVIAIASLAALLVRMNIQERRRWRPSLVAIRAIASSQERDGDVDGLGAAELAVLSKGHPEVLERAAELAGQDADLRRWSTAVGGIVVARDLLQRGRVPGLSEMQSTRTYRPILWGTLTAAALLGAALTASVWWLMGLVPAYVRAVMLWADWREERHWGPAMVAAAARQRQTPPIRHEDRVVAAQLAALALGNVRILARARRLVVQWPGPLEQRSSASRRLDMAETLLEVSGLATAASQRTAVTWAVAAFALAATLVMTG